MSTQVAARATRLRNAGLCVACAGWAAATGGRLVDIPARELCAGCMSRAAAAKAALARREDGRDVQPLAVVLGMLAGYSDGEIARDVDSALQVTAGRDRATVQAYAAARRGAADFQPGKAGHNNHRRVSAVVLTNIINGGQVTNAACNQCGGPYRALRASSRYCSDTCRKASSRAA